MKTRIILTAWFFCLAVAVAVGDDHRWTGAAQDIIQKDEIVIAGDWSATGETISIPINNKTMTMTTGSTCDTTAEVAAGLAEVFNSDSHDDAQISSDVTVNVGGQEIAEFREITATASGSTVFFEGNTPGKPFTFSTVTETSVGTATHNTGGAGNSVACTGKHWFNNADNWHNNTAPAAADHCFFVDGDIDCLYGLNDTSTVNDLEIRRSVGYTGDIGLEPINRDDNGWPYSQVGYRTTHLQLPNSGTGSQSHKIGADDFNLQPHKGKTYLDLGAVDGGTNVVTVSGTEAPNSVTGAAVKVTGGYDVQVLVSEGTVEVGGQETDTWNTEVTWAQATSTGKLIINQYANITATPLATWVCRGEQAELWNLSLDSTAVNADIWSGTFYGYHGGSYGTVNIYGGKFLTGLNITTLTIWPGGIYEKTGSGTITNTTLYGGGVLENPSDYGTFTNPIDWVEVKQITAEQAD